MKQADAALSAYIATVAYDNPATQTTPIIFPTARDGVRLRPFPYPFQAMLAIESDADHVTLRKFNIIHEFLNSKAKTPLGLGLGLDVSDSFFLYNGSNLPDTIDYQGQPLRDEMTFFQGTSHHLNDGAIILHYLHVGWIDTFHSIGDFSRIGGHVTRFRRSQAVYAMSYLQKHGIRLAVFTDHGNQSNVANFGAYGLNHFEDYQQGDNPASSYFISDLLRKRGVRFVWPDLFSDRYSYSSVIYPIKLRDGRSIWGFWRFTGTLRIQHIRHAWKYDWTDLWNPGDLATELAPARLQELVRTHGFTVIATHLEGNADKNPLSTSAIESLTRLSHIQDRGKILVARTSRLLTYNLVRQYLQYRTWSTHGTTMIDILAVADPVDGAFVPTWQQLRGITFTVPSGRRTRIELRGLPLPAGLRALSTHTIGVKWYPPDTHNYAVWSVAQLNALQSRRSSGLAIVSFNRSSWVGIALFFATLIGAGAWFWRVWRRRHNRL